MSRPPLTRRFIPRGRLSDSAIAARLDRAWRRGRLSLGSRARRVYGKAWLIAQAAIAAGIAWFIAADLFGREMPFFAPIVAVVCLGTSYGQRLRRVVEVTIGVALGVFIGDLFVQRAGSGAWQIAAIVAVGMAAALFLDAGQLMVAQAAVQGIVVAVLASAAPTAAGQAFVRFSDALVGGAVALVAATIVPAAPLRRPRHQAAVALQAIADLLRGAAANASSGDVEGAAQVLIRARDSDPVLRELRDAADEGLSVLTSSPFFRRHERGKVITMSQLVEPIDRAHRATRMLIRRVTVAAYHGEPIPLSYAMLIERLAGAVDIIADAFAADHDAEEGRAVLTQIAADTAGVERTGILSNEVILAQIRSTVVDLLQVAGIELDDAVASLPEVPPLRGGTVEPRDEREDGPVPPPGWG